MKKKSELVILSKLVFLPIVWVIISIACISSGKLMTLNLSEKNLNLLIGNPRISLVGGLEIKVDNADIQEGFIRFFTTVNKNGESESAGFFDINLLVSEERIFAEVINTEFSGGDFPGESKDLISQYIENELNQYVQKGSQRVIIEEINYVQDGIQLRFRIPTVPTPTIFK